MKSNITVAKMDMPTLRQMVLENSRRISENEMQIKEMRMENTEQSQKERERDEWWEQSRRKHDLDMQEIREMQKAFQRQMAESAAANDLALKKSREDFDKRMQESQERHDRDMAEFKEMSREMKKNITEATDQIKGAAAEIKGAAAEIKGAATEIKNAAVKITEASDKVEKMVIEVRGITGHIVEGLISTTTEKMFQRSGFDLANKSNNIKRKLKAKNLTMEVDVLLNNDETAIPIEVKSNCTKQNIDHLLKSMENFRELFPEYAEHEIIAGIAAINYERDAYEYAQQQGLLVIHVSSDFIFSIAPFNREKLQRF